MSEAPAGWQPDPRGRHEYRYWDGSQWTDHVANQGQVSSDPVADETPPDEQKGSSEGGASETRDAPQAAGAGSEQRESTEAQPAAETGEDVPNRSGVAIGSASSSTSPSASSSPSESSSTGTSALWGGSSAPEGSTPSTPQTDAKVAAQDMLKSKSMDLGTILSVIAPGSGHFYMGADKVPLAAGLLVATVVAVVLAYFSFLLFLLGFVIWVAAAAFAVSDLRGGLTGVESTSLPKDVLGTLMLAAGVVLVISVFLPWYHVSGEAGGASSSTLVSGLGATKVIAIILVLIGVAAIVAGAALLELGPLSSAQMPDQMPLIVGAAAALAVLLVLLRLIVAGADESDLSLGGGSVDASVGRAPGILLALDAGLVLLIANAGALRSAANR